MLLVLEGLVLYVKHRWFVPGNFYEIIVDTIFGGGCVTRVAPLLGFVRLKLLKDLLVHRVIPGNIS